MAQTCYIGWYGDHAIRIFEDPAGDEARPWKVVFEPVHLRAGKILEFPEQRDRTLDAAKSTAKALAQNIYQDLLGYQDYIDWKLVQGA